MNVFTGARQSQQPRKQTAEPKTTFHISEPWGRVGYRSKRVGWLMLVAIGALGFIATRLLMVQVVDREQHLGEISRHITRSTITGERGNILARDGSFLATTDSAITIGANPRLIVSAQATALGLAPILNMPTQKIYELLSKDLSYVHLQREVPAHIADRVRALELPGIEYREEPDRVYPNGNEFARNLLGQVDRDEKPLNGIELQFADLLAGQSGSRADYVAAFDSVKLPGGDLNYEPPKPGYDIETTLHAPIQRLVEEILKDAVLASGANWATAIVLDVPTAEVLALADIDHFKESGQARVAGASSAYAKQFEPGSVAKTFTIAAAIEEGLTWPDEVFNVPHLYQYSDKPFREPYVYEDRELTVTQILSKSSNIGTIQIAERLGPDQMYHYLRAFGLGQYSSGDRDNPSFPHETRGKLKPPQDWEGIDLAAISFGQGVSVTAIQIAAAYNTIANNGKYKPSSLVRGFVTSEGASRTMDTFSGQEVLSATTAKQMRAMLESVVMDGTGKRAAVEGYGVGGKTGTAQKPLIDQRGYGDSYTTIFAGFAPVEDPKVTVVVVLDEPLEYKAGFTAAPVFSEITARTLGILGVPKTR